MLLEGSFDDRRGETPPVFNNDEFYNLMLSHDAIDELNRETEYGITTPRKQ